MKMEGQSAVCGVKEKEDDEEERIHTRASMWVWGWQGLFFSLVVRCQAILIKKVIIIPCAC